MDLFCPDCGGRCLTLIERTESDAGGEHKEVRTCEKCENIVYIVRKEENRGNLREADGRGATKP